MKGYAHLGFLAVMLLGMLSGCSSRDPYARDDVWYPSGAPAANLAAQLANPADLAGGRDDPRQHSAASIKAVDHIWSDSPKALVVAPTGAGGSGGGGGGGGGGSQAGGI